MDDREAEAGYEAEQGAAGILQVFGRQLKRFREWAGLERPEFGTMTGYSASTIAAYEQGRRIPRRSSSTRRTNCSGRAAS